MLSFSNDNSLSSIEDAGWTKNKSQRIVARCLKWVVYVAGITLISLMLRACASDGSSEVNCIR